MRTYSAVFRTAPRGDARHADVRRAHGHPVVAQAAIAHAQFETIHPFLDGNGRTGRTLVQSLLRRRGTTTNVAEPVSAGLLHDIERYFGALNGYRQGDADPIVTVFADAAGTAVRNGNLCSMTSAASEAGTTTRSVGFGPTRRRVPSRDCCSSIPG